MPIYTKTGDKGETSLFGGKRVSKSDELVKVYGSVDELNSWVGFIVSKIDHKEKKEFLVYDTTRLPIKITIENSKQSIYEKLDKPKHDLAVKLVKFEHGESSAEEPSS